MLIPTNTTGRAAEAAARSQEAVMGKAVPQQHPAVVLRSHYAHLRALLVIAMIAVVGLTVAVVIVANDRDDLSSNSALKPAESVNQPSGPGAARYDGGPEEGTAGLNSAQAPVTRYDGGPEEGTQGIGSPAAAAALSAHRPVNGTRYDGGPEEGTRGIIAPSRGSVAQPESPAGPGFSTD
ncbi:MAG TPA: hypothetical protein VNC17_06720 [Thermoleophilaceae bacterium]|nr:hypothetical protein [Thermoleophilaceae bacterium]